MGTVYLGEDPRLGRTVAIKVLPEAADPVALGRFVREARTAAALHHPHIAVLHDVGEQEGVSYLVMERVDGETLAAALARGALPWRDVLHIGLELASALAHAHGLGVLHRDIKPNNIMLAPGRGAVLLDFGVAQRVHFHYSDEAATESVELERLTKAGHLVGTAPYMSPEQLEGRELDARSDLFQLGVTLYEAVGAAHPFAGPTGVDVLHAILREEPRPLEEVARVPQELARIVGKLLEKDPGYRYPEARALEVDLRGLERQAPVSTSALLPMRRMLRRPPLRTRTRRLLAYAAVALLSAGLGYWAGGRTSLSGAPRRVVPLTYGEGNDTNPSFSPDGKSVVFASDRGGPWDLWVGLVAGGPPLRITDTPEVEDAPAWSPDGARVAFERSRADGRGTDLHVMAALGGEARRLVDEAGDPAWSPDGRWLAYADFSGGWTRIARVEVDGGGAPVPVTQLEEGFFHRRPAWTPDGETLVFNRSPGGRIGQIVRVSRDGGPVTPLTRDPEGTANVAAAVTPDGRYAIHVSDRGGAVNLWRVPLSGGPPERVTSGPGQHLQPQVSRDGRRIAFVVSPVGSRVLAVAEGAEPRSLVSLLGSEAWAPSVSPDGVMLVFAHKVPGEPWRLALTPRDGGSPRTLLEGVPTTLWAKFRADGAALVFDARFPSGSRIGVVGLDGRGLEWLTDEGVDATYPSLAPDGAALAFVRGRPGGADIVLRTLPDGEPRVLVENATLPTFSPDGRRIGFARSRSYAGGVGFVELADGEPRWLTTSGTWPTWTPDGESLAYADAGVDGDQAAWLADIGGAAPRAYGSFRWAGAHYPFSFDPTSGALVTTNWGGSNTTLWLAEY